MARTTKTTRKKHRSALKEITRRLVRCSELLEDPNSAERELEQARAQVREVLPAALDELCLLQAPGSSTDLRVELAAKLLAKFGRCAPKP